MMPAMPGAVPMMPMMHVPGMPVPPVFPQVPFAQPIPGELIFSSPLFSVQVASQADCWIC